jgi:hypothetical protein
MESSSNEKKGKADFNKIKEIAKQTNNKELLADAKRRETGKNVTKWEK